MSLEGGSLFETRREHCDQLRGEEGRREYAWKIYMSLTTGASQIASPVVSQLGKQRQEPSATRESNAIQLAEVRRDEKLTDRVRK